MCNLNATITNEVKGIFVSAKNETGTVAIDRISDEELLELINELRGIYNKTRELSKKRQAFDIMRLSLEAGTLTMDEVKASFNL